MSGDDTVTEAVHLHSVASTAPAATATASPGPVASGPDAPVPTTARAPRHVLDALDGPERLVVVHAPRFGGATGHVGAPGQPSPSTVAAAGPASDGRSALAVTGADVVWLGGAALALIAGGVWLVLRGQMFSIPLGSVINDVTTTGSAVIDLLGLVSIRLYDLLGDVASSTVSSSDLQAFL